MGNTRSTGPGTTSEQLIRSAIAAERRDLADLLESLTPEQWDAPSLCAGWRVREVAAHMSLGFRYPLPRVLWQLVRARGSLHLMTDRCARADAAAYGTDELAGFLREHAHHPWTPPVGGFASALGHDVVHGMDITVALGLDRRVPEDRVRILLDHVTVKGAKFFGADLAGVQLCADDLDRTYGSGAPLRGAGQDLLLAAFGRAVPRGRLHGEPSGRFTAA
ncbi:maleylpyruvate isomerase family mycothiol-dependent enzyme [Streptomyces sp. MNP-20]|uniref:maleylpyruvate isomerase family mycothiol-dependent enzyme n=1 Tax=Streptomyces sp. MNP-20 TaxID=2721165 RepID=UPI001556E797|nr:maleylpyruvate isomerase family mycothiol-dependent enzyme [Streptomyces sp. MNP-20]